MVYIESREFIAGILSHITEQSKRFLLTELCDTAYKIESKQQNLCINIDNDALSYIGNASGNTIEVTSEYVFISNTQDPLFKKFINQYQPQGEIAELLANISNE